jgi:hypothetical protein
MKPWFVKVVLSVFVAVLVLAPAGPAFAGTQDFTLVNKTGLRIVELYVSASSTDDWEEDVLGVDVLEDDEAVDIHFSPKEKAKSWDLKIVDSDGDEVVWEGLRLNDISRVTLRYDKQGNPVADLE